MPARSKARKRAVNIVFEADQRALTTGEPMVRTLRAVLQERLVHPGTQASLPEYAVEAVEGMTAQLPGIDEVLSTYSQGWTLERMPAVDRSILRIATWELLHNDGVPDAVAIDEAVRLGRELSTDDSPAFINGLLGRLASLKPTLLE